MRRPPIENAPNPAGLPVSVSALQKVRRTTKGLGRENVYFLLFEENRFVLHVKELSGAASNHVVQHLYWNDTAPP
jgi:hypothetical protein